MQIIRTRKTKNPEGITVFLSLEYTGDENIMKKEVLGIMKGMTQKKEELLPKIMWLPLFFTLAANTLAYYGSRLLTGHRVHYNLTNALDECIPFVPWTVSIYLGCYLFWIANYVIGCRQKRELAVRGSEERRVGQECRCRWSRDH